MVPIKILVIGPSWVGDMVMAQSLFMRLETVYPDAQIDVLAPGWSQPIVARMPQIRACIKMPLGHGALGIRVRRELGHSLRVNQYDQAIVLPRSYKSALVPWFANIPIRIGYTGESRYGVLNDRRTLDKAQRYRTVDRYVALSLPKMQQQETVECPQPQLMVDAQRQQQLLVRLGLLPPSKRPAVAFMPGAEYGPAKRWPPEYFGELASHFAAHGQQVWILGSAKEQSLGAVIAAEHPDVHNLCGRTELADTVDLLAMTKLAIGNDSGLMHIAAAAGCEVVVIYGSSDPNYTPPLTDKGHSLHLNLSCMPCGQRVCPLQGTEHHACMMSLTPEYVFSYLQSEELFGALV